MRASGFVSRRVRAAAVGAIALVAVAAGGPSVANPLDPNPPDDENHCLDPDGDFDPGCVPGSSVGHLARQACDYEFLPGCDLTAFADPGYAVDADPKPRGKLAWRIGAVHEHSGYSDGEPVTIPRDYFRAAKTGDIPNGTGVKLDFLWSSEHSDNAQITPTTNASCLTAPATAVGCGHFTDNDFYWKWPATLRQAVESTDETFTGMRGFEWTNDFYNHMNVYFSTNFRNVKIDGSYLALERMWEWLQRPVEEGGGADGLVTFNHPGGNPKLTPFDGGFPHTEVLAATGAGNWNDLEYVPEVDDRVVGMEINGGEDIEFYVKALSNGWHIGAVAAEDHHGVNWASRHAHKTAVLTTGRWPQEYYWALANRRTVALHGELIGADSEGRATFPKIDFTADSKHVLGSIVDVDGPGQHRLHVKASGLPPGTRLAIIGSQAGQAAPIQVGAADAEGLVSSMTKVTTDGDDWYFVVACRPAASATDAPCGSDRTYSGVTAPIWFQSAD